MKTFVKIVKPSVRKQNYSKFTNTQEYCLKHKFYKKLVCLHKKMNVTKKGKDSNITKKLQCNSIQTKG